MYSVKSSRTTKQEKKQPQQKPESNKYTQIQTSKIIYITQVLVKNKITIIIIDFNKMTLKNNKSETITNQPVQKCKSD